MSNILFFNFQTCIFKRECEPSVSNSVTLKPSLECYFVKICGCLGTPFEKAWLFKLETKGHGLGPAGTRVESPWDLASVPMCARNPRRADFFIIRAGDVTMVTLLKGVGIVSFLCFFVPVTWVSCGSLGILFSLTVRLLTQLSN